MCCADEAVPFELFSRVDESRSGKAPIPSFTFSLSIDSHGSHVLSFR